MALARDRCICLRKIDYSETSQILALFGRGHGLLRVIAKGAHRRTKAGHSKFDGGADLLDVGEAVFTFDAGRDLNLLTEWHLAEGHLDLRRSLRGMYLAQYAAELTSLLFEEHDAHPALYDRLEQTIPELGTGRAEEAFLAFELDLVRESGYMPELNGCGECGAPVTARDGASFFSPDRGGIVCRNCEGPCRTGWRSTCASSASCRACCALPQLQRRRRPPAAPSPATRPTRSTACSPTTSSTRSASAPPPAAVRAGVKPAETCPQLQPRLRRLRLDRRSGEGSTAPSRAD